MTRVGRRAPSCAPTSSRAGPGGRRSATCGRGPCGRRCRPRCPTRAPTEFDLSVGGPDTSLFPLAVWRRLVSATLRPSLLAASAYEGGGHPGLQAEIARYAGLARSVVASPEDVLLTNGAQQGLDVVARAVLDPGDVVVVEDPGYTAATRLFASHGAARATRSASTRRGWSSTTCPAPPGWST